ncbi:DUF423 domain-containing protein [Leptolyngbya sp. FACHB-711]|uniref:DUF423 domain-containing protein n=1 Tax=Leptolyngbya sp. FACHB-711 TaxID=2692813 RepID=UPI001687B088|nr:DUF423 domain-containing protein [Leptolyngbya sp. FACHB-711]MBD2023626.1 DUF423 domain-containing protein [Leptolyngbya sp. FACHB-711]
MQIFLTIAAVLGGLSVAAGAFGAHALEGKLTDRAQEVFETAARYQMYHALALVAVAILLTRPEAAQSLLNAAGIAFIVGVVLFCGSLYALSLSGVKILGAVAPIGGLAFIIGWGRLAVSAWTMK